MIRVKAWVAFKILWSVAFFFVRTHRYYAAIEFFKEWLELDKIYQDINSSSPDEDTIFIYHTLATTFLFIGNYSESKANAKCALRISKNITHKKGKRRSYYILSCVFETLCRFDKAIKYLEKALQISKEIGDVKHEAAVCCSLGEMNYALGEYEKAEECELKAIEIAKKIKDKEMETMALFTLNKVLTALGKLKESRQIRGEGLKISEETGNRFARAATLTFEALECDQIRERDKSLELIQESLQISEEIKDREREGWTYFIIGGHFAMNEQHYEAIKNLENALEISSSRGDKQLMEQACISLFEIHLALGQKDRATKYKEQVMKSIKEAGVRKVPRSLTLTRLATGCAAQGDLQQACEFSSESVRYYENEIEPLREEYKLSVGEKFKDSSNCYRQHMNNLIDLGRDLDALLTAERGRARVLKELLTKNYAIQDKVEPLNENNLRVLIKNLKKKQTLVFIANARFKTVIWVMKNKEHTLEIYRYESSKANVCDLLEATLQINFGSLSAGGELECEDRSLSAFYDSESTSHEGEGREMEGKRLIESDDEENRDDTRNAPRQLYDMLIAPFADCIDGGELVLAPEGSMFMIPFPLLQDTSGRCLSEKCKIRIIPSLSALKLIQDCPADYHSQRGVLIVGDPDVSRVPDLDNCQRQDRRQRKLPSS